MSVAARSFLRVSLQHAEKLEPRVREELEQLVAALQHWAAQILPIDSIPVGDITIDASQIVSGILRTARGGTGVNGSSAPDGYLLIGNGSGFTLAPLTAGAGISFVIGPGSIQIIAEGIHTHATDRFVGDGATVDWNLLSFASMIEGITVDGLEVDPSTYTLSDDGGTVTFNTAPASTKVIVFHYVVREL